MMGALVFRDGSPKGRRYKRDADQGRSQRHIRTPSAPAAVSGLPVAVVRLASAGLPRHCIRGTRRLRRSSAPKASSQAANFECGEECSTSHTRVEQRMQRALLQTVRTRLFTSERRHNSLCRAGIQFLHVLDNLMSAHE